MRNNEQGELFREKVPINIIIEASASGSELIMNNMDIVRSSAVKGTTAYYDSADQRIAPFIIKAPNTNIVLSTGSKNKIDGTDSLLTGTGYRTALYMYAADGVNNSLTISGSADTSLTTVNGGINAVGVNGATTTMSLTGASYNLTAAGENNHHGIAFGSGYVEGSNVAMNLNLQITDTALRAIGETAAIGNHEGMGVSNIDVSGTVKLEAFSFNSSGINGISLPSDAIAFTTEVNKNDNWGSIIMHPYREQGTENNSWELTLPATGLYAEETQAISVLYSNPELNESQAEADSPFTRLSLRIIKESGDLNFLANMDGTGSTTPLISAQTPVTSNGKLVPNAGEFDLIIPNIVLRTNYANRTLQMPVDDSGIEEVRKINNDSLLPLYMSFGGYELNEAPADIADITFATNELEFNNANGLEDKMLLLELHTEESSGDVSFTGSDVNILVPHPAEEFSGIATLRGKQENVTSAVNLHVQGRFTEAMTKDETRQFGSTVYLRWSVQEFAEF